MLVQKTRWSKVYESSEEELVTLLRSRGIAATVWEAAEFETVPERQMLVDTDIWLAEGSASFQVGGKDISMQPGDTILLPANTILQITAGMSGCTCYESPR